MNILLKIELQPINQCNYPLVMEIWIYVLSPNQTTCLSAIQLNVSDIIPISNYSYQMTNEQRLFIVITDLKNILRLLTPHTRHISPTVKYII